MPILEAKLQIATENDFFFFFFYSRAMTFLNNPNNRCEPPPRQDLQKIVIYMTY